jgi:hypothetical protein
MRVNLAILFTFHFILHLHFSLHLLWLEYGVGRSGFWRGFSFRLPPTSVPSPPNQTDSNGSLSVLQWIYRRGPHIHQCEMAGLLVNGSFNEPRLSREGRATIRDRTLQEISTANTLWLRVYNNKKNSMVWVRERTIPTEGPPLVGEVSANFCG